MAALAAGCGFNSGGVDVPPTDFTGTEPPDAGVECVAGTILCVDGDLFRCDGEGGADLETECSHGCIEGMAECNECRPGSEPTCRDNKIWTCNDQGKSASVDCSDGCVADAQMCNDCDPNDNVPQCVATTGLEWCTAQGTVDSMTCPLGCTVGTSQCHECTPNSGPVCESGAMVTCNATGTKIISTCPIGCINGATMCNECVPGIEKCEDGFGSVCSPDGKETKRPCAAGCSTGRCCLNTDTSTVCQAALWQNQINAYDVNADGNVTVADRQAISARLGSESSITLPAVKPIADPFYDVNGDGRVSNADRNLVNTQLP